MAEHLEDPPSALEITLDRKAEVPIGVQLVWAIRARIDDGRLPTGSRLPGMSELAEALELSRTTVQTIYMRLEQLGLVEGRQGKGTFVTDAPTRAGEASLIASRAAEEALASGVNPREVAATLYTSTATTPTDPEIDLTRRRILRTQIAALQQALDELRATHPAILPDTPAQRAGIAAAPRLPSTTALEETRRKLLRRLATAQAKIDAHAASEKQDAKSAAARAEAAKPRRRPRNSKSKPATQKARRPRTSPAT